MDRRASARALALLVALALASGRVAQASDPRTVESVDLGRYVGQWFEIARFPNDFQSQCVGNVTATYQSRDDGRIDVINRCRTTNGEVDEAVGVARVTDPQTRAKLEVRFAPAFLSFLPFVWGDYWVLAVDPEYRWAVVGTPDRSYLWILARAPALTDAEYQAALASAAAQGFDVARAVRTPHDTGAGADTAAR
ncbi:lipocalin family protein [Candidatus Binatia bacterium]|nr:lipocalin family protein [Candidatus Binatia bacterium]